MEPKIVAISEIKAVGKCASMNFIHNTTEQLWRSFMPERRTIGNRVSDDLISIQIYDGIPDFENFDPAIKFQKWAAAEVNEFPELPTGMNRLVIQSGLYAVFHYKGIDSDTSVFRYIFGEWLPGSGFTLDDRPHFEILGEKYRHADPESEEEIWVPVKPKANI